MPHAKLALFESLGQYMDLLMDAICVVNADGEFIYISAGGERVFGYTPKEMLGHSMFEFMHPDDHERTRAAAQEIMQGVSKYDFENRYIRKDGSVACLIWSARYATEDNLRIAVARDVTKQRRMEREREQLLRRLERQAHYDPLTGLPNRSYFYEHAEHVLTRSTDVAVAYIDLDRFKHINDEWGHAMGDQVLHAIAQRLLQNVRSHDTIARIGGDEFVILFERVQQREAVEQVAQNLIEQLRKPIALADHIFHLDASIGVAMAKPHVTLEQLLQRADAAMYQAKRDPKVAIVIE